MLCRDIYVSFYVNALDLFLPWVILFFYVSQEYVFEHHIHNQSSLHYNILIFGNYPATMFFLLHLDLFTVTKHEYTSGRRR
jgi:hypothetical protein